VIGFPAAVYASYEAYAHISNDGGQRRIVKVACPRVFDRAHEILASVSPLAAPPIPGVSFTQSLDLTGRVDLNLTWINSVAVSQTAVAVQGVYGEVDQTDFFIDHTEPKASSGGCWNWYHYNPRDDAAPKTVDIQVKGLWPDQQYCFFIAYQVNGVYSKPSPVYCQVATWEPGWGKPAQAPTN
jgi:hypothetical protein